MKGLFSMCGQPAAFGLACAFTAGECPEHGFIPMEPPLPAPTHGDARKLAKQTLLEVGEHRASPMAAGRFIRSLRAMESFGESEEEREQSLKETAVVGGVLHGIPPTTSEKWAIAEKLFDPVTILELRRVTPMMPMTPEDHAEWLEKSPGPVYGSFMSGSPAIWGHKAIDYSKPVDTGQPMSEPDTIGSCEALPSQTDGPGPEPDHGTATSRERIEPDPYSPTPAWDATPYGTAHGSKRVVANARGQTSAPDAPAPRGTFNPAEWITPAQFGQFLRPDT